MYSFQDFVQFIFSGLTSGAIYAMLAIGFGVVHNIMGIVNFTQVDFVSLGGMLLLGALVGAKLPMGAAVLAAVVGVTLTGALVEFLGISLLAALVMSIKFLVRRKRPAGEWGNVARPRGGRDAPSGRAATAGPDFPFGWTGPYVPGACRGRSVSSWWTTT